MYRILLVSIVSVIAVIGIAKAEVRHFDGEVILNGDALPIRLHIDLDDAAQSTLDIPQLWYAEEPLPVQTGEEESIALTFPFGFGEITLARDGDTWTGASGEAVMTVTEGAPAPYRKEELRFGAAEPEIEGTLYIPEGEGPFPAVIIVGGSGAGARDQWTYRSKGDYYARMGVAAFIYDRRRYETPYPDGSLPDFWTNASDIAAARDALAARTDILSDAIGLQGGSQGVWLSTIAQTEYGGFAFIVMTGVPAVSPGEQNIQMTRAGMRDDGLSEEAIADAVAYERQYFAVAHTGLGWDAFQQAIAAGEGSDWLQYVDQPQSLEDLDWWHRHQAYEPRPDLMSITIPILAMTGEGDWITPPTENLPLLAEYARLGGNQQVRTMVIPGADHRLERSPYRDDQGQWHWFEIASEVREAIPEFLRNEVGLTLAD